MEFVIVNEFEAYMFLPIVNKTIRLWSSDGKVRDIIAYMQMPFSIGQNVTSEEWTRIQIGVSEDTTKIDIEVA